MAGNVGEGVGDLLSRKLPVGSDVALGITVKVNFKQDQVAEGVEDVRDLVDLALVSDAEFIR